jgi:tetratricopeptide (TPR) repeat protein
MDSYELIHAHRYEEAAAYWEAESRRNPDDPGWLGSHAQALLCLGRLEEALDEYQRANELHNLKVNPESKPFTNKIGAIQWLLGDHSGAIETFRAAVDGVLNGSIKYGDSAGGVAQGLLLWYAGVTAPDDEAAAYAIKYLRERASRKIWIQGWPGALALFVLGRKSEEEVLIEATKCNVLRDAIRAARDDLLSRRRLARALFYFAVRKRSEGLEKECHAGMVQCASLENPIIEVEWYLARGEAGQGIPGGNPGGGQRKPRKREKK